MSFVQYLNHGKVGESIVAQWLRSRGYNVLPIYEKELDEKKGPALYACTGSFVAPDMLVFRSGSLGHDPGGIRWIEAKTKSAFTWHRQTEQWTTGIDKRLYRNYLQVMKLSPWPLWIMFLHLNGQAKDSEPTPDTGLFGASLETLSEHIHHRWPENDDEPGMIYWAYPGVLRKLVSLEELTASISISIAPLPSGGWQETRFNGAHP